MKKFSKIFCLILAVALVCTGLVMIASAEETTFDLASAVTATEAEGTVKLTGNAQIDSAVTVDKDLTIDLGGYTVSSSAEVLFEVKGDVTFTIIGTGAINVDGMVFRTEEGKAPNVTIEGTKSTTGIDINHTGTMSENISYTYTGTYLYKNLDITTSYVGAELAGGTYHAFLKNKENINAQATYVTLDSVEFRANNVRSRNHGMAILSLAGTGSKLTIKNSGLYTTGSGIELSYARAVDENGTPSINAELAYVENSVISCVSPYISGGGFRNIGLMLDTWSGSQVYGTFTLKDSLFESTCRAIFANDANNIKVQVNAINSIIRNVRERDDDNVQLIERHVKINLDKDSRIASIKATPSFGSTTKGTIKASVGTRINTLLATNNEKGIFYPDGTYANGGAYKWVYDPVTDPEFPYVCVEATDTTVATPIYKNHFTFDNIRFTKDVGYKLGAANAKTTQDGGTVHYDEENLFHRGKDATTLVNSGAGGMQWDVKMGSFYYGVNAATSNYVRYVVTNDVISGKTNTISGNNLKSTADPYFIVGGCFAYENNLAHVKESGDYQRTKVAILNFDFGTDSAVGYPRINVQTQTRYGTKNSSRGNDAFAIANDGTLTNKLMDAQYVELNDAGEWNHLTVVYYTDTEKGSAHYFLNGEYMGYSNLYNKDEDAYIMGARFNIVANVNHVINSSLCFDNISFVAYADYLNGEVDGATSRATAENYVTAAPANTFIKSELNKYSVNGISSFDSFSDAVALANNSGTVVELTDDYAATVNANGIVNAGEYEFDIDSDSYGFVKDGNSYTFNENYKYDIKWYIGEKGNLDEMLNDEKFVTATAKLGHVVDKAAIWTDEEADWSNYTVFTQNGWAYNSDSSVSVTPFIPTLADLEAANESAEAVALYPSFGSIKMAAYLKDSTGNIAYYMNDEETTNAYHALKNGQTLVLLKDLTATKANAFFSGTADTHIVVNLDLNGYKFIYRHSGAVAWVSNNATLNVYSSQPGGHITSYYYDTGTWQPNSQRMFGIAPAVNTEGHNYVANVDNAHINIGTFGDIPGSNMKISGGVLLEGVTGDANCSITMDGVLAECVRPTSGGVIMARYYNGDITVTNSTFVYGDVTHQLIDIKSYGDIYYTPTVTLDGCTIMGASRVGTSDSNLIATPGAVPEGSDHKTIVIKNIVSTKRVNPTENGDIIDRGDNVTAYKVAVGSNVVNYNAPITFESLGISAELVKNGYYELVIPVAVDGAIVEETVYIVENGKTANAPAGAKNVLELYPVFEQKATTEQVQVNWKNFDGTNARTEKYAVGGYYENATSLDVDEYKLNAVKLVHNGTWNNIPEAGTVLTESVDVNPGYTVESNLSGLKANLSLYSDFLVNLYIPAELAQYVTSVNDEALEEGTVSFGEAAFAKAIVAKNAKEASDDAVFEIAIKEGDYTATKTVKISITDYASQILAGEFADTDKVLMYYMLSYVAEAAKYLGGEEDAEIAKLLADNVSWNVITVEKTFANAIESTGLDSIFNTSGITLGEAPAFSFTPNGKFTGTVTVTYGDGNVRTYNVPEGSTSKIVVEGMKIYNFGATLTVTATGTVLGADGEQTVTGTINLDTYAKYHTENAANENSETSEESKAALDLINALYDYVEIAEQYKAGTLSIPSEGGEN